MTPTNSGRRQGDNELLIRLDEKVNQLIGKVQNLEDNVVKRVDVLEQLSAELVSQVKQLSNENADKEIRIRRLETWGFMAIGALAVLQLILKYI